MRKPWYCQVCEKRFSRVSALKRHDLSKRHRRKEREWQESRVRYYVSGWFPKEG